MKDIIQISQNLTLDLPRLIDTKLLVQANSGGGKSWLLRLIAEQAIPLVQTIIIDPEGEYSSLREAHDLLIVGSEGEIRPNTDAAGLLARKLAELQTSAVIDLYDLSRADQRRFVRLFLESLLAVPKSLYHPMIIAIDEAHLFAPERSAGEAESTQAVISLMTLGRKRGFCSLLATQRLSKLHKDASEVNNVCFGRTWLDVDLQRAGKTLGMNPADYAKLRDLAPGEFFGFGPAFSIPGVTRFTANQVRTTHPKAGQRHLMAPPRASEAIQSIVAQLKDLPEQAKQEALDLAQAQARIRQLERELKAKPQAEADPGVIQRAIADAERQLTLGFQKIEKEYRNQIEELSNRLERIGKLAHLNGSFPAIERVTIPAAPKAPAAVSVRRLPEAATPASDLPKGEQAILTAIAQYPEGATREQLTILTGFKRSTRDAYLQRLRTKEFIEQRGSLLFCTESGTEALGSDFEPLPTGEALQEHWLDRLPEGEGKILEILLAAYPAAVAREALSEQTGYARSSRDAYLQRLSARRLVSAEGRGAVVASKVFFEE